MVRPTIPAYNSAAMQNDAPLKMPTACDSMEELRAAIDTLDARLVVGVDVHERRGVLSYIVYGRHTI